MPVSKYWNTSALQYCRRAEPASRAILQYWNTSALQYWMKTRLRSKRRAGPLLTLSQELPANKPLSSASTSE